MSAKPSPPLPRTCCPSAPAKSSTWTAAFISGDYNGLTHRPASLRPKAPAKDRAVVGAVGGEDTQFRTRMETSAGRAGLHGERPLHLARLDGVDAGLPVRLGIAPVRCHRRPAPPGNRSSPD